MWGIQKKIHGSRTKTSIISNEEMNDIVKIVQAPEHSNILLKKVIKTFKQWNKKKQKRRVLSMLLGTLGASLLGNLLAGKGVVRACSGNKKWKGIVIAGSGNNKGKGIVRAGTGKNGIFNAAAFFNKF